MFWCAKYFQQGHSRSKSGGLTGVDFCSLKYLVPRISVQQPQRSFPPTQNAQFRCRNLTSGGDWLISEAPSACLLKSAITLNGCYFYAAWQTPGLRESIYCTKWFDYRSFLGVPADCGAEGRQYGFGTADSHEEHLHHHLRDNLIFRVLLRRRGGIQEPLKCKNWNDFDLRVLYVGWDNPASNTAIPQSEVHTKAA